MNKKVVSIAVSCLTGASIVSMNSAISKWGKISMGKDLLLFGICFGLLSTAIFLFGRYKLGSKANPNITNPGLRKIISRYPVLVGAFAIIIGVVAGVCCMQLLAAADKG